MVKSLTLLILEMDGGHRGRVTVATFPYPHLIQVLASQICLWIINMKCITSDWNCLGFFGWVFFPFICEAHCRKIGVCPINILVNSDFSPVYLFNCCSGSFSKPSVYWISTPAV